MDFRKSEYIAENNIYNPAIFQKHMLLLISFTTVIYKYPIHEKILRSCWTTVILAAKTINYSKISKKKW